MRISHLQAYHIRMVGSILEVSLKWPCKAYLSVGHVLLELGPQINQAAGDILCLKMRYSYIEYP